jgi:tetratricopeptide (TPR) repeat protein
MRRQFGFFISFALLMAACASTPKSGPITSADIGHMTASELITQARESSEHAQNVKDDESQRNWALHGISVAEQCLMRAPEEPGCYYYRAINTGLYHEVKIIGYQKGVKQMIDDCEMVIKLDPKYDHGGAYRILGQIYAKLPQSVGRPDSITRDLDKAENYLRQAVRIDPDYPENHLFLAETLFEKEKFAEATAELAAASDLSPRWRLDKSHDTWQSSIKELQRKITKKN